MSPRSRRQDPQPGGVVDDDFPPGNEPENFAAHAVNFTMPSSLRQHLPLLASLLALLSLSSYLISGRFDRDSLLARIAQEKRERVASVIKRRPSA